MKFLFQLHYNRYVFTLLLILGLTQPLLADTQQTGLLWQISKPGLKASYLLGTIHSDDPRVIKLPPAIHQRFTAADSVTIEMTLGFSNIMKSFFSIYLPPAKTLDRLIDKTEYTHLVKLLNEYGVPEEATKRLKPLATMMILSMPKSSSGEFLDLQLYQQAQAAKQAVYGLETVEEQLAILDVLTIEEQIMLLKDSLKHLDDMPATLEKLHELYLQRDLTALLKFNEEQMKQGEYQELEEKLMQKLIGDRNVLMTKRMQPRLSEGNAFIAVGALHLPGDKGILKLLEAQGYRTSPVY